MLQCFGYGLGSSASGTCLRATPELILFVARLFPCRLQRYHFGLFLGCITPYGTALSGPYPKKNPIHLRPWMHPLILPSLPTISFPLKSLHIFNIHFPFNASSVPLFPQASKANRPHLLVCHDMKGGYQDDKWVQGDDNGSAYPFGIGSALMFSYISYILCWANAAHKHGVQILGTFITEWDEGAETCKALLASKNLPGYMLPDWQNWQHPLGLMAGWYGNVSLSIDPPYISAMGFSGRLTLKIRCP